MRIEELIEKLNIICKGSEDPRLGDTKIQAYLKGGELK